MVYFQEEKSLLILVCSQESPLNVGCYTSAAAGAVSAGVRRQLTSVTQLPLRTSSTGRLPSTFQHTEDLETPFKTFLYMCSRTWMQLATFSKFVIINACKIITAFFYKSNVWRF